MQINDYVIIKDSDDKIIYTICDIYDDKVLLKGVYQLIKIIKNINDIVEAPKEMLEEEQKKTRNCKRVLSNIKKTRIETRPLFGRILHIDGDKDYLESCMSLYKEMGIYAEGIYIPEEKIKYEIEKIILKTTPDIIVITGHDIYNGNNIKDLSSYENTKHYIDKVRNIIKKYYYNDVVIIVGACGSNFEALIASGANFASSPARINIHTYDPAVIAIVVASTSVNKNVDFNYCLKLIENGRKAFGGVETKGKMRMLL